MSNYFDHLLLLLLRCACVRAESKRNDSNMYRYIQFLFFLFLVNEIEMENNSTVSEINNMHEVLINCHNVILTARSMFDAITNPSLLPPLPGEGGLGSRLRGAPTNGGTAIL